MAQLVKNLQVTSQNTGHLDSSPKSEDRLEKEIATHSSIIAWGIPWTEEAGGLWYMGSQRVGHYWVTNRHTFMHQFSSVTQSCPTLSDPMNCSAPGLPVHHQLLSLSKLMSIESVMPSNHFILCHTLLLLPSIFPNIRVFSNESVLRIRWPKY